MRKRATANGIPWPGPRPYDEEEWELFYGRKQEVIDLLELIGGQDLTVLAGKSGSGKTSLIRAGVLPALRLRRYSAEVPVVPPAVLMRDWGGAGKYGSVEEVVAAGFDRAVNTTGLWEQRNDLAKRDFASMREVATGSPTPSVVESISRAARAVSDLKTRGLVCIFDQFEEILRLGEVVARDAVLILRDLYKRGSGIRLVICLREEYLADLRGLERAVGGLVGRTYFLSPLRRDAARAVVEGVARAANIEVEPGVVEELFRWMSLGEGEIGIARNADRRESKVHTAERGEGVDLLRLQAILFELASDYVAPTRANKVRRYIGDEILKDYRNRFGPEDERIVANTLTRWIQRAFDDGREMELRLAHGLAHRSPRDIFQRLIERLAVRLAPHLSSSGYKVSQEESDLFRKAAGEDVWALGLMDPLLRSNMRIEIGRKGSSRKLDGQTSAALKGTRKEAGDFLSGIALEEGWSKAEAAQELLYAFLGGLEELREGNILKLGYSWEGRKKASRRWELVHDGLGDPLIAWAQGRRDSWLDCAASLVVCRGVSPIGISERRGEEKEGEPVLGGGAERLAFVRWEGCQVAPWPMGTRAVLEGLSFERCVFRGTIFESVVFLGCKFIECDLDGTVFRRCEFGANSGEGSAVEFLQCHPASLALLGSTLNEIRFIECNLRQFTMSRCRVGGKVKFEGGELVLSDFSHVRNAEEVEISEETEILYCGGDPLTWEALQLQRDSRTGGPIEDA